MWKFRSMYRDADERLAELKGQNEIAGAMFKMRDDPRVTKIGKFIRKHSIDEFPQFVNVFLGQMSVACARRCPTRWPSTPSTTCSAWPKARDHRLVAGDGSQLDRVRRTARRDLEYIANRGIFTDLKIVILTVIEVITGKGAC